MNRRSFLLALVAGPPLLAAAAPPERFNRCPDCGRRYDIDSTALDPEVTLCSDCYEELFPERVAFSNLSFTGWNGEA